MFRAGRRFNVARFAYYSTDYLVFRVAELRRYPLFPHAIRPWHYERRAPTLLFLVDGFFAWASTPAHEHQQEGKVHDRFSRLYRFADVQFPLAFKHGKPVSFDFGQLLSPLQEPFSLAQFGLFHRNHPEVATQAHERLAIFLVEPE